MVDGALRQHEYRARICYELARLACGDPLVIWLASSFRTAAVPQAGPLFSAPAPSELKNLQTLAAAWDRRSSRHDECFDRIALRRQCSLFPDNPRDHFRVADDSFRIQNRMLTRCFKTLFSKRSINRGSHTREVRFTAMDVRGSRESDQEQCEYEQTV
jgi:hypothetical protein